jgi:hypothetical protein
MERTWLVAASAVLLVGAGCASAPKSPEPDVYRDGRLGHPLGAYLSVEGVPETRGKVGTSTLLVDTVDGRRIEPPVSVWVDNVTFAQGSRAVLKGYESGRYIGMPIEVTRATGMAPQAGWQFQRYFIATSIESGGASWSHGGP